MTTYSNRKRKPKYREIKSNRREKENIDTLMENGNLSLAMKCTKEYLEKYPKDLGGWYKYGKLLRFLKKNQIAKEVLLDLLSMTKESGNRAFILLELIYLAIDEYDLKNAFRYFHFFQNICEHSEEFSLLMNANLLHMFFEAKSKPYISLIDRASYEYFSRQFISYQEDDFFQHTLIYNLYGTSAFCNKHIHFSLSIDLYTLYEEIKRVLPFSTTTPNYSVFDTYYFLIPNIGIKNSKTIHYLKVLVIPDKKTYNIVEFGPCLATYKTYINDFKKLKEEESLMRTKRKN